MRRAYRLPRIKVLGLEPLLGARSVPIALIFIAITSRAAWSFIRPSNAFTAEAQNVALSLAKGTGFSDAYFVGSGPTAHLMPVSPLIDGAVYAQFGSLSTISNTILTSWAIAQMALNYLLAFTLFGKLGSPRMSRIMALGALCCVPIFLGQESVDFRYWEGGLALAFCLMSLHCILFLHSAAHVRCRDIIAIAVLASLTFILNPAMGLTIYLALFAWGSRRYSFRSAVFPASIMAGVLLTVLAPWVIRNSLVMGHPIVLRDNLGLELSLANNDYTAAASDDIALATQYRAIHPSFDGDGRSRLMQIGEYSYLAELQRQATTWISSHPLDFGRLCLRHLRQMYFPDYWQLGGAGNSRSARVALIGFVSALGLVGLFAGLIRDASRWRYLAAVVLGLAVFYMPFQPVARYLYPLYVLLVFCAADFSFRAAKRISATVADWRSSSLAHTDCSYSPGLRVKDCL